MSDGTQRQGGMVRRMQHTEAERRQLLVHLQELVKARGMEGAAQELGLSARTLRRARASGTLTPTMEEALVRHSTQALASRDTPWWRRADALTERLDRLERVVREMSEGQGSLEESYRKWVEEVGAAYRIAVQRVEKLEEAVRDLARLVESQHPGVKADASRDSAKETHDEKINGVKSAAVQRLVDEVNAAWANEQQALQATERLAAHGRRLEAELQLIRDQGQTWPPGQIWSPIRHADEVGWRLRALEANQRERRRLQRRSWLGLLWARRPWRNKRLFR